MMFGTTKRLVADVAVAGLLLYLSVWVYELANLMVLSIDGHQAAISVSYLLPLGTASISGSSSPETYAKLLQVSACAAVAGSALLIARRARLVATELASISVLAVYLSSFYWEELSLAPLSSYPVHVVTFIGIAGALNAMLFVAMARGRR